MPPTINIVEIGRPSGAAAAVELQLQGFEVGQEVVITLWEDNARTFDSLLPEPPPPDAPGGGASPSPLRELGKVTGTVAVLQERSNRPPLLTLSPSSVEQKTSSDLKLLVCLPQKSGPATNHALKLPAGDTAQYEGDNWELWATARLKGKDELLAESPTSAVARVRRALDHRAGECTYKWHQGHAVNFYHDGAHGGAGSGYFADIVKYIRRATDFIFIADWSFHAHARFDFTRPFSIDNTIGAALIARAVLNPTMLVAIHTWTHKLVGQQGAPDDYNDAGADELDRIASVHFKLPKRPDNLLWVSTARTGVGWSHHQKFVALDQPVDGEERLRPHAFIGGLDLTKGRFDYGRHPLMADDPACAQFLETLSYTKNGPHVYDDWYNPEFYTLGAVSKVDRAKLLPRQPWHDIAVQLGGPAAWDVVREFVGRYQLDPSWGYNRGDTDSDSRKKVLDKFKEMLTRLQDPEKPPHMKTNRLRYAQQWHPGGGPWAAQVYRSIRKEHWAQKKPVKISTQDGTKTEFEWKLAGETERSIQDAYLRAIAQAQDYVYIETQYFISSGSNWGRAAVANRVAQALADRAVARANAGAPFHIYLIIPMFPEGVPGSAANAAQRNFEWRTILWLARKIQKDTGKPFDDLFTVYFLATWEDLRDKDGAQRLPSVGGTREENVLANRRYMIYVHSKFMLVDDRYMIIGSANLNERSLAGDRDTEICVGLWPNNDASAKSCVTQASNFRNALFAEHLGPGAAALAGLAPSSPAHVKAVRDAADANYVAFREGRLDSSRHGHLCRWRLDLDEKAFSPFLAVSKAPEGYGTGTYDIKGDDMIPDRPHGLSTDDKHIWRFHCPSLNALSTGGPFALDIAE